MDIQPEDIGFIPQDVIRAAANDHAGFPRRQIPHHLGNIIVEIFPGNKVAGFRRDHLARLGARFAQEGGFHLFIRLNKKSFINAAFI